MPKLSRRKRQLKEMQYSREQDGDLSEDQQDNVSETPENEVKQVRVSTATLRSNRNIQKVLQPTVIGACEVTSKVGEKERGWVQCNTCDKWRSLPPHVNVAGLPDIWTCELNYYDTTKNFCDAPEESYKLPEEEEHVELKSFLKLWTKKLRNADRAENCLSSSAVTRGRKRKQDSEWIQCSSASCGKWRSVSRGIETASLLRRLNKGRHFGSEGLWYCSMNSWDDTTASCAAPQEPLWNCKWNLNGAV